MPAFSSTPETKFAIVNYVRNITHNGVNAGGHSIGKLGPVPEGMVAWTLGIGVCVALTLWIGARR